LEIAISGGKHSPSAASSSEGGLVIDLSEMRRVKVDTRKNYIIAQGGCLWADVDAAGAQYGLATGLPPDDSMTYVKSAGQLIIRASVD